MKTETVSADNVDMRRLKRQKATLIRLRVQETSLYVKSQLSGLIHLLDVLQDSVPYVKDIAFLNATQFGYKGTTYVAQDVKPIEGDVCAGCDLPDKCEVTPLCSAQAREDKRDVIWKKRK